MSVQHFLRKDERKQKNSTTTTTKRQSGKTLSFSRQSLRRRPHTHTLSLSLSLSLSRTHSLPRYLVGNVPIVLRFSSLFLPNSKKEISLHSLNPKWVIHLSFLKGENVELFPQTSQLKVISLCYRYHREVRSTTMALTLTASTVVASVKPTVSTTRRYVRVVFARFPKCFVFLRALGSRENIRARALGRRGRDARGSAHARSADASKVYAPRSVRILRV